MNQAFAQEILDSTSRMAWSELLVNRCKCEFCNVDVMTRPITESVLCIPFPIEKIFPGLVLSLRRWRVILKTDAVGNTQPTGLEQVRTSRFRSSSLRGHVDDACRHRIFQNCIATRKCDMPSTIVDYDPTGKRCNKDILL